MGLKPKVDMEFITVRRDGSKAHMTVAAAKDSGIFSDTGFVRLMKSYIANISCPIGKRGAG